MLRWRTEALLLIKKDSICPKPGGIVSHPPMLRLLAPFKGSLAERIERTGRGFKRQQAHLIGFQVRVEVSGCLGLTNFDLLLVTEICSFFFLIHFFK